MVVNLSECCILRGKIFSLNITISVVVLNHVGNLFLQGTVLTTYFEEIFQNDFQKV